VRVMRYAFNEILRKAAKMAHDAIPMPMRMHRKCFVNEKSSLRMRIDGDEVCPDVGGVR